MMARRRAMDAFDPAEVERAGRYHRPQYVALLADVALGLAILVLTAFASPGDALFRPVRALAWWAAAPAFAAEIVAVSSVIRGPLAYWRGFRRERTWGFSTETLRGWLIDRLKALAIGATLSAVVVLGFVWLARTLPSAWPLAAGPAAMAFVLLLSFVAPVVLEPVFNRFAPLPDRPLAADLRALADRAGVPVREVLVADASRRTRKGNAYVSGLGRTRRVVVFDTLLSRTSPEELSVVVAHELGHRRLRHVALGTALGMAGAAGAIAVLWALLRSGAVLHAIGASRAGDPRAVPFVLLVVTVLEIAAIPAGAALSRRWESAADRFSLEVTRDPAAFEAAHRDLALANLIDLDPPGWVRLLLLTHPTPPERIASARDWDVSPAPRSRPTTA